MRPGDRQVLGVKTGDLVRNETQVGRMVTELPVSPGIHPSDLASRPPSAM
ncbi:MAG: hypothetical protein M5R42_06560 [Rhodocyclaceae bacterium]|nr:hypothetical protein [Rhodocyclaceae bacterium]